MNLKPRLWAHRVCLATALGLTLLLNAGAMTPVPTALSERDKAAHVLNRLGYGPRPGEIERVAAGGVENWIRQQLQPRRLPDPVAQEAVAVFAKLQLSTSDLVGAYQAEQQTRQQARQRQAEMNESGMAMAAEVPPRSETRGPEGRLIVAEALGELMHAKLARAVLSERQLEEVLVDFWFNHFNVDVRKQLVRATVVAYEQDVIRPRIWGSFRDLLGATAASPAMLVYLDNARSSRAYNPGEREMAQIRRQRPERMNPDGTTPPPARTRGLNENYGRELLELHTLGVDGGYTQQDVQEVARAFTGWTLEPQTGKFVFRARWHDDGAKTILGKKLPAGGGQRDGERVLDLLAVHPSTARQIARKLCQRFVADQPPAELVERVAAAFQQSQGNLRKTYEALFLDPAFFDREHFGTKSKSPFEFVASSLRATAAQLTARSEDRGRRSGFAMEVGAVLGRGGDRLANLPRKPVLLHLAEMGQPLYAWAAPTGFPEDSSFWVGAGALVARLNFALALASGQVAGTRFELTPLLGEARADEPAAVVDSLARNLLAYELSPATRGVLLTQGVDAATEGTGHTVVAAPRVLALLLGSPEFQRR